MAVDYIAANVSSLRTHNPQVKFLSLEVKKCEPNIPLKVEKAKVDKVLTKIVHHVGRKVRNHGYLMDSSSSFQPGTLFGRRNDDKEDNSDKENDQITNHLRTPYPSA